MDTALQKIPISYYMLSDCCKKIAEEYEIKVSDVKKLIPNLSNKINYAVHYKIYWKNILILILKKEQMLLIVLKKIFLNWGSILLMAKQWKKQKRFFKIH